MASESEVLPISLSPSMMVTPWVGNVTSEWLTPR